MDSFVPPAATPAEEPSLFAGIDTTIPGLALLVNGTPPPALVSGLRTIADHVSAAQKQFDVDGPFAAAPSLLAGLNAVRTLRQQLATLGLAAEARFNIDARLKTKEDQFTEGALLAHGLRVEVLSDDGVVVPGQDVRVSMTHRRSRTAGHGLVRCARWLCDAREVSIWADGGWRGVSLRRHHANSRERQNHQTILEADPEDRALRVRA